jgi:hypothetical protein
MSCEVCGKRVKTHDGICKPCAKVLMDDSIRDEDMPVAQFLGDRDEPEVREYMGFMSSEMRDLSEE